MKIFQFLICSRQGPFACTKILFWLLISAQVSGSASAQTAAQPIKSEARLAPGGQWPVHSMERPRPEVVESQYDGAKVEAPVGALMLFDGTHLDLWRSGKHDGAAQSDVAGWKVVAEDGGFFQVVPGSGTILTREALDGDGHLHLEWATPREVKGNGQGRGNSGVFIGGYPEVQVLDSWENDTYPDGQAGALYGQYPPLVNASRKPGEWQAYDIFIERAQEKDGKVIRRQRISLWHNGVLVQDAVEFDGRQKAGTVGLQDHGNPMRFRNIWFQPTPRAVDP